MAAQSDGEDRKQQAEGHGDHERMQDKSVRVLMPAGACGPCHGRGHPAADPSGGHHRHQHPDGKHQRDANQRFGAETRYVEGLSNIHESLCDENADRRERKPHHCLEDRAVQHGLARPKLGCAMNILGRLTRDFRINGSVGGTQR